MQLLALATGTSPREGKINQPKTVSNWPMGHVKRTGEGGEKEDEGVDGAHRAVVGWTAGCGEQNKKK
jgi:hypothetical protein